MSSSSSSAAVDNAFQQRLKALQSNVSIDTTEIRAFENDVKHSRLPLRRQRWYLDCAAALRRTAERNHLAVLTDHLDHGGEFGTPETTKAEVTLLTTEDDPSAAAAVRQRAEVTSADEVWWDDSTMIITQTQIPANGILVLKGLEAKTIVVKAIVETARLQNLKECQICLPAARTSVSIDECSDCVFWLVARQLRVHDTVDSLLSCSIKNVPILERCSGLKLCNWPSNGAAVGQVERLGSQLQIDWNGIGESEIFDDVTDETSVKQIVPEESMPKEVLKHF